jgi:DNA repair protein SbcC/Rad50
MIKTLRIKNFQNHVDTSLQLSKGVNVIIGPSDSGKSAVLRSLYWLFWNRPSGDSFRSFSGGDTSVEIEVDKHIVSRIKTKTRNEYSIDGTKLRAIGSDVPEEISNVLNIDPSNVQRQLDGPFLLGETSGNVAQHFNRIAKLDILDLSRKNVEKWTRDLQSDIAHSKKQAEEYREEIDKYDFLERLEPEVEILEQLEGQLTKLFKSERELHELMCDLENTQDEIGNMEKKVPPDSEIEDLLKECKEWDSISKQAKEFKAVIGEYTKCIEYIDDLTAEIAELELEFKENMPEICPLCEQEVHR